MTKEDRDICGEPTADGTPCERRPGFGTDRDEGPCFDHVQDRPVLQKFTEQRRERIIGAASSGAFKKHIAQLAEIKPETLTRWLRMGETDAENGLETDLAEFYREWQRARGAGAIQKLQNVDPEFILERGYGYTKRQDLRVDGDADLSEAIVDFEETDT